MCVCVCVCVGNGILVCVLIKSGHTTSNPPEELQVNHETKLVINFLSAAQSTCTYTHTHTHTHSDPHAHKYTTTSREQTDVHKQFNDQLTSAIRTLVDGIKLVRCNTFRGYSLNPHHKREFLLLKFSVPTTKLHRGEHHGQGQGKRWG